MRRVNWYIIAITFIGFPFFSYSQEGSDITIHIEGMQNEKMLLAYHYAGKHYIKDTFNIDEKGVCHIQTHEPIETGVYLIVFPSLENKYFEMIVSEPSFTVHTNSEQLGSNISFNGSTENEVFYKDMDNMIRIKTEIEGLRAKKEASKSEKEQEKLDNQILELGEQLKNGRIQITKEHPKLFYTTLLNLMRDIDIPESPKDEEGNIMDSMFAYKYFRSHYWDYTDFSKEGILRTPVFHRKLLDYFSKYTSPVPDSLSRACDEVLTLAAANKEVFRYVLVHLFNQYANSKIMGQDAVYVHLGENYYLTGKAEWADSAQLAKIEERVIAMKPTLIGKVAPNVVTVDTTLKKAYSFHHYPADYKVLYIWDPECGHCKKSTPKLQKLYPHLKKHGIEVFALSTVGYDEVDKWKAFTNEHKLTFINTADPYYQTNFRQLYDIYSTPKVYIVDKNNEVIANRMGVENITDFFENYFKQHHPELLETFILEEDLSEE